MLTRHGPGADAVLRSVLSRSQDSRQAHICQLHAVAAHHGSGPRGTVGQLRRASVRRTVVSRPVCRHTHEPVHLLPVVLAVQFRPHHPARPLLHHAAALRVPSAPLGSVHGHIGKHVPAHAQGHAAVHGARHHGTVAPVLRHIPVAQTHHDIPPPCACSTTPTQST